MSDLGSDFKDTETADVQYSMLQQHMQDPTLSVFAKYKILRNAQKRGVGIGLRLEFSEKDIFKEKLYEATIDTYHPILKRIIPPDTKWDHDSYKDTVEEFIKAFNLLFKTKNKFEKIYNIPNLRYINANCTLGTTSLLYMLYTMGIREYPDEDFIELFTHIEKTDIKNHVNKFDLFRYIRYFTDTDDLLPAPMYTQKFKVFSTEETDMSDMLESTESHEFSFTNLEVEMQPEKYYVNYVINDKYHGRAVLYDIQDPIDNIMYQIMYTKNLGDFPFLKSYLKLVKVEHKYEKRKPTTQKINISGKDIEIGGELQKSLDKNWTSDTYTPKELIDATLYFESTQHNGKIYNSIRNQTNNALNMHALLDYIMIEFIPKDVETSCKNLFYSLRNFPQDKSQQYQRLKLTPTELDELEVVVKKYVDSIHISLNSLLPYQINFHKKAYAKLNTDKHFSFSELKQIKYTLKGTFITPRQDLYIMFNSIKCGQKFPFIVCGKFVKVKNNWIPSQECQEWFSFDISGGIYIQDKMYIYSELDTNITKDKYIMYTVTHLSSFENKSLFEFEVEVAETGNSKSLENLVLELLIDLFPDMTNIKINRNISQCMLIIKPIDHHILFTQDVFFDFAMNHPLFSKYIKIVEKHSIHREKGGLKFELKHVSNDISIYVKTNVKMTDDVKILFRDFIDINDLIYKVDIKKCLINNKEVLNSYIDIFKKLFGLLVEDYKTFFVSYYSNYLDDIHVLTRGIENFKSKISARDKELFPELFISGYKRKFQKHPTPYELTDENLAKLEKQKQDFIIFPKPTDKYYEFIKPWILVCEKKKENPFVAFSRNNLSNSNYFKWIPTCHKTQPDPIREKYYSDSLITLNDIEEDFKVQQSGPREKKWILEGPQIGDVQSKSYEGQQGTWFPSIVRTVLNANSKQVLYGENSWIRYGTYHINKYPDSIIRTISEWKREDSALNKMYYRERTNPVLVERFKEYIKKGYLITSGLSIEKALRIFENREYIDPQLWKPLLEAFFNVNIVIFYDKSQGKEEDVELLTEKYSRYRIINTKIKHPNTMFFMSHYGQEFSGLTKYPQTEIIVYKTSKKVQFVLMQGTVSEQKTANIDSNEDVVKCALYLTNTLHPTLYQELNWNPDVLDYTIDTYNKIRGLTVIYKSVVFVIKTTPITHIPKNTTISNYIVELPSYDIAYNFLKDSGCYKINTITSENNVHSGSPSRSVIALIGILKNCTELTPKMEDTEIVINIIADSNRDYNIEEYNTVLNEPPVVVNNNIGFAQLYNTYTRIKNMLLHYVFYIFSSIYLSNLDFINSEELDKSINTFEAMNFIVIKNHQYLKFTSDIDITTDSDIIRIIDKVPKIIVTSEELIKRLVYNLRLKTIQDIDKLNDYKFIKYIENYYTSAKDFTQTSQWSVYNSRDEAKLSVNNINVSYELKTRFYPSKNAFFINIPSKKVLIAKQEKSVDEAILKSRYLLGTLGTLEDSNVLNFNQDVKGITPIGNHEYNAIIGSDTLTDTVYSVYTT